MIQNIPIKDQSEAILIRISCPNRAELRFSVQLSDTIGFLVNSFIKYYQLFEHDRYVLRHSATGRILNMSRTLEKENLQSMDLLCLDSSRRNVIIKEMMTGQEVKITVPFPLTYFLPEVLDVAVSDEKLQLNQDKKHYLVKFEGYRWDIDPALFSSNFVFRTLPDGEIKVHTETVPLVSFSDFDPGINEKPKWPSHMRTKPEPTTGLSSRTLRFQVLTNAKINLFIQVGWPTDFAFDTKIKEVEQLPRGKIIRSGGVRACDQCGSHEVLVDVCHQCGADCTQWTETEEAFLERKSRAVQQLMEEKAAYRPPTIKKSFPLSATAVDIVHATHFGVDHSYHRRQPNLRFHDRMNGWRHYFEVRCLETRMCLNDKTDLYDFEIREGYTIVVDSRLDCHGLPYFRR